MLLRSSDLRKERDQTSGKCKWAPCDNEYRQRDKKTGECEDIPCPGPNSSEQIRNENGDCEYKSCPHPNIQKRINGICKEQNDCEMSNWSDWSECPSACGTAGTQTRSRNIIKEAEHGGKCDEKDKLVETKTCPPNPCPSDCKVSNWSNWSECPSACGAPGIQTRNRNIIKEAEHRGKCDEKDKLTETKPCPPNPCQIGRAHV